MKIIVRTLSARTPFYGGVDEVRGLSRPSADGPAVCCYRKGSTNPSGDRRDKGGRAVNNKA
ncbi:MAG TPA: hypothetical protein VFF83_04440 [Clostridia bacterium]|nr:hypothetical protein [Clostridia bacterium]